MKFRGKKIKKGLKGLKGSITLDVFIWACAAFALGLIFITAHWAGNTIINKANEVPSLNSSISTVTTLKAGQQTFNKFDYLFFGFFIGSFMAILIIAWFIGGHPVMFIAYFLILVVAVIVSAVLANVWTQFYNTEPFSSVSASAFPMTNHILTLLPFYVAAIGMMGLILMYAKPIILQRFM